jgi:ribosomal protein L7/L12
VLIALIFIVVVVVVLLEFHRRLRAVEDRLARLEQPGVSTGGAIGPDPSAEVKVLAESGRKLEAMRLYRQQSGAELRVAKEVVEGLSEHGPGRA